MKAVHRGAAGEEDEEEGEGEEEEEGEVGLPLSGSRRCRTYFRSTPCSGFPMGTALTINWFSAAR